MIRNPSPKSGPAVKNYFSYFAFRWTKTETCVIKEEEKVTSSCFFEQLSRKKYNIQYYVGFARVCTLPCHAPFKISHSINNPYCAQMPDRFAPSPELFFDQVLESTLYGYYSNILVVLLPIKTYEYRIQLGRKN